LYDVFTGERKAALQLSGNKSKWRKIAHILADRIYSQITSETGMFDSHVVYVATTGPRGKNVKKTLIRMDQDGENQVGITNRNGLFIMPKYSPDGKLLAYLDLGNKQDYLQLIDTTTGGPAAGNKEFKETCRAIGEMNFSPRFMPDSNRLLMSISRNGLSAIYMYDLRSRQIKQLTPHSCIDVSPCSSPDGSQIVFASDRGGDPDSVGKTQLYVMDANGSGVKRISFGEGRYSQPIWSKRGDYIAFTKQLRGQFYIGLMSPDGSNERLIASGYKIESPEWSPNGRYLVYTEEVRGANVSRVVIIDITGRFRRTIKTSRDAGFATWSPLLSKPAS